MDLPVHKKEQLHVIDHDAFSKDNDASLWEILPKSSVPYKTLEQVADKLESGFTDKDFANMYDNGRNHSEYGMMRRLRMQFWNLYNEAQDSKNPKILPHRIYAGITSAGVFRNLMKSELNALFLFTQPQQIRRIQEDLLYEGYRHMEEVLMLPIMDKLGNPDHKMIDTKIKILGMIENRYSGSVVQRQQIHQETKVSGENPAIKADYEKLKEEVAALEKELGKQKIPEVVIVKSND